MGSQRLLTGFAALALVAFTAESALAQASETIGVHVKQWWPELSGSVKGGAPGTPGTNLDLHGDLGLFRENEGVTELGIWGKFPMIPFKVFFTSYAGAFNDGRVQSHPSVFEGVPAAAGDPLSSELILRSYTLMFDFGMGTPAVYQTTFLFGFQVGMQFMDHSMTIKTNTQTLDEEFRAVVPMVGLRGSVRLGGLFEIYALLQVSSPFSGISTDFDGHYLDFTLELRWWAMQSFAFGFGYRLIQFFGENRDNGDINSLDVQIHGFLVSLVFQY